MNCKCSKCSDDIFKHKCTSNECSICEMMNEVFFDDCYCKKCEYAKSTKEEEKEKGNDNKIKIITGIVCPGVVIIFIILAILYFRCFKCKKKK